MPMRWFVLLALIAGSVLTGVVRSVLGAARSFDDDEIWDDDDDGDWLDLSYCEQLDELDKILDRANGTR